MVVQWGYQNPWRIEALGAKLTSLDLARILSDRRPVTNFNNSERRLVTVFLWQQGKLEKFMRLISARDRAGYSSYFEAVMGRPLKEITPLGKVIWTKSPLIAARLCVCPQASFFPIEEPTKRPLRRANRGFSNARPQAHREPARMTAT